MPKKWVAEDKLIIGTRPEIPDSAVKSAARVVQIMELFDEIRREANVVELCTRLGYPQSSTSALLRTLVDVGFLVYNPVRRTYLPSVRAGLLASWVNDRQFGEGQLTRMMSEINERSGEVVILAARNRLMVQYIQVMQAKNRAHLQLAVGAQRPIVGCGSGCALLSAYDEMEIYKIAHVNNAYAKSRAEEVRFSDLMERVSRVRGKGYAFEPDLVRNGGSIIAMLLPLKDRSVQPLVVGIGAPTKALVAREEEFVGILRDVLHKFLKDRPSAEFPAAEAIAG